MSKKRKLKVKIKNKNKNQNIIHIKIDNSKKTKSRSNQNQKQHQPSIPNIIIQSPQTQPDYSNILYQMLQNNEKRNASIPIPNYTQQPIKNTNVTPQFTQTEQSSLNILPSIPNTPSQESFNNYIYHEHSYEEHDDSPKSIFTNNPTGENEFEEIIQNNDPINVSKDNENRKETPEEQQQRLQEERLQEENISKKKPKETDKEKYFRKAQDGNDKYVKKYIEEYIIKGKLNNDTGMLNDEEFEIYKRYRKIVNPKAYNTTKVPTYGAVKKYLRNICVLYEIFFA